MTQFPEFQIVLLPTNSPAAAALFYKTREKAEEALLNIHNVQQGKIDVDVLKAKDDYGYILSIPVNNISYALFVDLAKQAELGIKPNGARAN